MRIKNGIVLIRKRLMNACAFCTLVMSLAVPGFASDEDVPTDYVDLVDPHIMSARGRWFFFGTGKRLFGMVNVFPDTKNAGQGGGEVTVTSG